MHPRHSQRNMDWLRGLGAGLGIPPTLEGELLASVAILGAVELTVVAVVEALEDPGAAPTAVVAVLSVAALATELLVPILEQAVTPGTPLGLLTVTGVGLGVGLGRTTLGRGATLVEALAFGLAVIVGVGMGGGVCAGEEDGEGLAVSTGVGMPVGAGDGDGDGC